MRNYTVSIRVIGVTVGMITIVGGLGWLTNQTQTAVGQVGLVPKSLPPPAVRATAPRTKPIYRPVHEPTLAADIVSKTVTTELAVVSDGDAKIGKVLTADTDFQTKCEDLFDLYSVSPEGDKIEIARHLCMLITEENYAPVWEILIDPQTPSRVDEVILDDLFNRSDSLTLPLLLQVARTPSHPMAQVAQENLASFMQVDHGTDWAQWELTLQTWLKSD